MAAASGAGPARVPRTSSEFRVDSTQDPHLIAVLKAVDEHLKTQGQEADDVGGSQQPAARRITVRNMLDTLRRAVRHAQAERLVAQEQAAVISQALYKHLNPDEDTETRPTTQSDTTRARKGAGTQAEPGYDLLVQADVLLNGPEAGQDPLQALELYRRAAAMGNMVAVRYMGHMFEKGTGVKRDAQRALHLYWRAVYGGDEKAKTHVARFYTDGVLVEKDLDLAVQLNREGVAAGCSAARVNLGNMYAFGIGVPADDAAAVAHYAAAAEDGNAQGQNNMGSMLQAGVGVKRDLVAAANMYERSVKGGNTSAMYNLAILCIDGVGVPQDVPRGIALYRRAAKGGHAQSMFNLGVRYERGDGVEANATTALHWYQQAAHAGHEAARAAVADLCRGQSVAAHDGSTTADGGGPPETR